MSSSSRAMASNYINTKIYYKNLYNQIKPIESICSVCSSKSNTIRMETGCYSCLEKKMKARQKVKKKNKSKKSKINFFRSFCNFKKYIN